VYVRVRSWGCGSLTDYRKVEVDTFVQELKHLTMDEKQIMSKTLKKFPTLFGGGLGMLNIKPVSLELIDGAKPYHARPFPLPQSLEGMTKTGMKILTDIDVFNRSSDSEWACLTVHCHFFLGVSSQ
jgi:hypothetical protein